MASPTVVARTETSFTAVGDPLIPFTQTTGDLVVIFLSLGLGTQTLSLGDGFSDLTAANARTHIIYKVLDGSEGGNVLVTLATDVKASAIAYNIQGHSTTQGPELSTVATATSTGPDPTTVTPTGGAKDYLWLAMFGGAGEEADDDTWCNSGPTSPGTFTNLLQVTSGIVGTPASNCTLASAEFTSNAASCDPNAFNTDQALEWWAYTVAVHPASGGVTGTMSVGGVGVVTITGRKGAAAAASITGVGVTTAAGRKGAQSPITIAGVGVTTATGRKGAAGAAFVTGVGTTTVTGRKGARSPITIAGVGVVDFTGTQGVFVSIAGVGVVTITGRKGARSPMTIAGVGVVNLVGQAQRVGAFTLAAIATPTFAGMSHRMGACTIDAVGTVTFESRRRPRYLVGDTVPVGVLEGTVVPVGVLSGQVTP